MRRNIFHTIIIHVHKFFWPGTCVFDSCIITARPLIVFDPYEALSLLILLGFTLNSFVSVHFSLSMVLLVLNHAYVLGFLTCLRLECKYCLILLNAPMLIINQRLALLTMMTSWGRNLTFIVKSAIVLQFSLLYLAGVPVTNIFIMHRSLRNLNKGLHSKQLLLLLMVYVRYFVRGTDLYYLLANVMGWDRWLCLVMRRHNLAVSPFESTGAYSSSCGRFGRGTHVFIWIRRSGRPRNKLRSIINGWFLQGALRLYLSCHGRIDGDPSSSYSIVGLIEIIIVV